MELLTEELRSEIPRLHSQEDDKNPHVYAKFFNPSSGWVWLVTEGQQDGNDYLFYGYIISNTGEWAYFSLNELEDERLYHGVALERDTTFVSGRFNDVLPTIQRN